MTYYIQHKVNKKQKYPNFSMDTGIAQYYKATVLKRKTNEIMNNLSSLHM